jgi:DNA-binding NarL/FixJ family response regulator
VEASSLGELNLPGLVKPVRAFNVRQVQTPVETTPQAGTQLGQVQGGPRRDLVTDREWEVAGLIARGLTNRQIASMLVLSERTAERHVENIRDKLGVTSRAQIAAWVVEQGHAARHEQT